MTAEPNLVNDIYDVIKTSCEANKKNVSPPVANLKYWKWRLTHGADYGEGVWEWVDWPEDRKQKAATHSEADLAWLYDPW